MKIKLLILAALIVFLATGTVFAQLDTDGTGFDPTQFDITKDKTKNFMTAPTGKMTDEIDMEMVARISVCHKGTSISEKEFNVLKVPYDITSLEFVAYYIQRLQGGEGASQFLEKWASRMPGLVAAVKAKGCKFGVEPEPSALEKCNGYCSMSNVCSAGAINKGLTDCQSQKKCHSCGFLGLKKCCEYLPTTCCEYPKPVTDCSTGMCTYNDCPEGTQEVGPANCGEAEDCETCWGLFKCCKQKQTKCCMAIDNTECARGTCQNGNTCPKGFKNAGMADCGSYEEVHSCGFWGIAECKDPAPRTCCQPE
ncbi:hypothetical protein A2316_02585 [Candidatus Falkowbacteria bacterium RIFOXYB2_FULL_38_15]|uniref:Uncharacterized protein n=1 Tax=Candidatus Falkowbacteria bacterium RIFOXYA2_FULL_38_12 TaxID=1797993 RepID=A0A1F5S2D9_9BACT|nr:MAG: hypothetical protein A2257_03085 [Candidatus Falkowbacteria bacterium RIFOXYA2_FULL_38_12]OGF32537.1 MAG: hypothetical protein A2316_02585 [Candidatus Falkowbacteria bacterium RIFOXYB2_FULL_38_15]OGF41997.1 MAG: hypothetical protein A2555_04045 [Candidatus Falkowbacteria bacterium RIFOXYD2_FULL_39_16]